MSPYDYSNAEPAAHYCEFEEDAPREVHYPEGTRWTCGGCGKVWEYRTEYYIGGVDIDWFPYIPPKKSVPEPLKLEKKEPELRFWSLAKNILKNLV